MQWNTCENTSSRLERCEKLIELSVSCNGYPFPLPFPRRFEVGGCSEETTYIADGKCGITAEMLQHSSVSHPSERDTYDVRDAMKCPGGFVPIDQPPLTPKLPNCVEPISSPTLDQVPSHRVRGAPGVLLPGDDDSFDGCSNSNEYLLSRQIDERCEWWIYRDGLLEESTRDSPSWSVGT